jgi:FkbM family methyltransferase
MISQHYFTFPFQLPRVIGQISNWPLYLSNYLLRRKRPAEYRLRNGYRLIDGRGTLAGTIAVVFVRREYGPMEDFKTILDIGANMGSFMVYAALKCPNAKIYCFEPEEQNFGFLSRNIAVNSLGTRVQAFRCAVAATNGDRELGIGDSPLNSLVAGVADKGRQLVNCTTLKDIFKEQGLESVDLLKMNCEGAEYEIFEGCAGEDFQRIPRIRLEYHNLDGIKRNGDWLAKFLEGQGYRIENFTRYRGESGFIWAVRK